MSSEAPVEAFYLISTKPTVSKQKAQKLDLKKWKTSLRDFTENNVLPRSFASSSESNAFYKDLNLCKRISNGIPMEIFCENVHKSLKRKSISQNNSIEADFSSLNNQPKVLCSLPSGESPQKGKGAHLPKNTNFNIRDIEATFEKKTLSVRCTNVLQQDSNSSMFSKNIHKPLKRKSTLEKICPETEFLRLNSQSKLCSIYTIQSPQMKKRTCPLKNTNFNVCDIQATFEKKTPNIKSVNALQQTFNLKLYQYSMFENDFKGPISKHNIDEELPHANITGVMPKTSNCLSISSSESDFRTAERFKERKLVEVDQCVLFKNKHNFGIPGEFSHDNVTKVLSKSDGNTLPFQNVFRTALSFQEVKHKPPNVDQLSENLLKSVSTVRCVGSDWVQSLQQTNEDYPQCEGKKKIQNVLVGGFCGQILKFQRRELSEKAVSEHKNCSKNTSDFVLLRINSIIHEYDIVIAECCVLDKKAVPEKLRYGSSLMQKEDHAYIALFQKSSFHKQQMKPGKSLLLSVPWHLLHLKSFKHPVIICKYFKSASLEQIQLRLPMNEENVLTCQKLEPKQFNPVKDSHQNEIIHTPETELDEDMFFLWKRRFNVSARIQRIWNRRISVAKLSNLLNSQNIYRLTFLLQTKQGDFYLLSTSSRHNLCFIDWLKFLRKEEGHFYFFENLKVSHRLEYKKFPKLFKYLQSLLKENKLTEVKQDFVYQLSIDGMTRKPFKLLEPDLPPFLPFNFQPLSLVMKNSRVSCKVKVLLQYCSVLYVSDESFFHSGGVPYVKVFLPDSGGCFSNSEISITEGLVVEGNLHLDEYSQISKLPFSNNELVGLHLKDAELPLRHDSSVADIVTVKGNITNVDETNACIWLQCNFCKNENLVQNSEEVIFCEDCCLVVNQPLLQVKMNVTISSETNILLTIELLSDTVKRILSLNESSYQPQCNVSDVLGKEVGPLLCYVRNVEILESHKVFYLREIVED